MAGPASGVIGSLRILVDADTAKAQRALKSFGGRAQMAGAAIGAGLGLGAIGALRIGDEYKAATDSIRIGTGATGDVLKGLEQSFQNVAGRVPDSIGVVGQALADVNTRTGLTGEKLEGLTESFIDLSRMMEVEASSAISSITRVYGDWSVATEDQIKANDLLLRASQASGMQIDKLAAQLVSYGAPLRNIGYEFEDAVAMLAKWEKEGVNTELALGGLKIALGEFAKEGIDAKDGLEDLIDRIQTTDDVARAMALGVSRFGSRAGPDMVAAIREGRFEFADFTEELVTGTETVQGLSDDTRDMGDAIKEMANRVKVAIGPITDGFAGIAESMGNAIFLLPALGGALGKGVVAAWQKVAATGAGQKIAAAAGAAAGAVYRVAVFAGTKLLSAALMVWGLIGGPKVIAAAAAAGTKAGAAYSAAVALATKGAAIAKGVWTAAGMAAGGIMGSALVAAILPVAAVALAALAAKMAFDLGQNIGKWQDEVQKGADAAVNQSGSEAIANLENLTKHMKEVQGLGRILGDTFGGEQQASGLLNLAKAIRDEADMSADELKRAGAVLEAAAHEAGARGNAAVRDEILGIAQTVSQRIPTVVAAYDPLSSITVPAPNVASSIRSEFQLATAEVAAGFGSIKAALQNPPQMISKGDRLANMAKRMRKIVAQIKKATEVGDPMAQRYWEKARAKQQQQIDKLKGKTTASLSQVKSAYTKAGVSVKGTWTDVKTKTVASAKTAATQTKAQADGVKTHLEGMDLTSAGTNLMTTWASGIRAGIASAVAAATEAAAAVAAVTVGTSPPPKGPLSRIDEGGRNVMEAWLGGFDPKRAGKVGAKLGAALSPQPQMGALAMAGAGAGALGGGGVHIHVGTLIADDAGIDKLKRRMDGRAGMKDRKRKRDFITAQRA